MNWSWFKENLSSRRSGEGKHGIQSNNRNSIANTTDLTLKQMFDISAKLVSQNKKRSQVWSRLGESFMEIPVIDWWRKNHQSSTHEGLRFFGFCVVSWKDPSISKCQQILGGQDIMDHNFSKLQRLWRNQWRADGIRVEHLPRIHYVVAPW